MDTEHVTLNQLVTFAIIMENNQGIIAKSPDYIREKFNFCMSTDNFDYLLGILDSTNEAKMEVWKQRWTSKK